jgi:hypothetical protein
MSEGWKEVFRQTADYADENGLELAIGRLAGLERDRRTLGDAPRTA